MLFAVTVEPGTHASDAGRTLAFLQILCAVEFVTHRHQEPPRPPPLGLRQPQTFLPCSLCIRTSMASRSDITSTSRAVGRSWRQPSQALPLLVVWHPLVEATTHIRSRKVTDLVIGLLPHA